MKILLKRASKISIIVTLLLTLNLSLCLDCVQAANIQNEKVKVFEVDYCNPVLTYNGNPRYAIYVVYEENGKQYPAYCLDPQKPGVGDTDAYDVTKNGYITDVMVWRIITNGYPYKSLQELGVANQREAYLATKQAVYCYLRNRNIDSYAPVGEAGVRTLNALKQILNNAKNSTETKISNIVEIEETQNKWQQDKINKKYISKTYQLKTPAPITDYSVQINGNIPEGLIITDLNNNEKQTFKQNEKFKILIPINELKDDGKFEIKVKTKMETKPVLFGVSPTSELQNYALTGFSYEDSEGTYNEAYYKNDSEIRILKQEKDTEKPLQGVEFELLDSNKKTIYQSLITNKDGEILIKNITPGTYYLREVRTLQGYVQYDELIKIELHLNELVKVIVNNSKEKNVEVSKEESKIEVSKDETNIENSKSETDIGVSKEETNIESSKEELKVQVSKQETNIFDQTKLTKIQKLPVTGM